VNVRLAVHLPPHQLPELQRAARALLHSPLLTTRDGDDFRLVLKWETVLRNEFGQKLGHRLDVSRSAARLLRKPASLTPNRGARLDTGRLLSRWGYVYLCLTLAALEHPGHQVLASELLARITNLARGDERLQLDTTEYVQRRAFRDAVRYLEQVGVLAVRDGDVESLLDDGQVLWDVDRDAAAMCMVAAPSILRSVTSVEDFVVEPEPTTIEARRRSARHRLNRRMVDQPVVVPDDLDDDEAELAWRNRRREAENISRLTGCEIELRKEGVALIDHPSQPIGSQRFPGSDSVAHAALLWLTALLEHSRPADPTPGGDDTRPAVVIDRDAAEVCWHEVVEEYGPRFSRDARDRPERFRAEVEELLERFRLVVPHDDGVAVSAFANRYRARPSADDDTPGDEQQAMF